jgi:hypothetical protein
MNLGSRACVTSINAGLATGSYERHRPEETVLYAILRAHWMTFLRKLVAVTDGLAPPAFVLLAVGRSAHRKDKPTQARRMWQPAKPR